MTRDEIARLFDVDPADLVDANGAREAFREVERLTREFGEALARDLAERVDREIANAGGEVVPW